MTVRCWYCGGAMRPYRDERYDEEGWVCTVCHRDREEEPVVTCDTCGYEMALCTCVECAGCDGRFDAEDVVETAEGPMCRGCLEEESEDARVTVSSVGHA